MLLKLINFLFEWRDNLRFVRLVWVTLVTVLLALTEEFPFVRLLWVELVLEELVPTDWLPWDMFPWVKFPPVELFPWVILLVPKLMLPPFNLSWPTHSPSILLYPLLQTKQSRYFIPSLLFSQLWQF